METLRKHVSFKRVMALLLSVIMVLSVAFANPYGYARAAETVYTFTVMDKYTSEPIEGAKVLYYMDVDDFAEHETVTDENGIAKLEKVTEKLESGETSLNISYEVTKEGYKSVDIINLEITDAQGNQNIEMKETVAPVIEEVKFSTTEWTKEDVTLTVVANDAKSGVAFYKKDGEEWQTSDRFTISQNGTYQFYAKDTAGNESVAYSIEVKNIDKDAPVISSVPFTPDSWTKEEATLIVNADDNGGSGLTMYRMDNGKWQASNEFKVSDYIEHSFYAKDALGNESVAFTASADKFDNTKPSISKVTPEDGWSNESIKFTVEASDNKSGVAGYTVDPDTSASDWEENVEWKTGATFTIKDTEEHVYYVIDNAGNVSEPFTAEIAKIEKEKPVISEVKLDTEGWTMNKVTFTVVATDEGGSGIAGYKMDDGEWQTSDSFAVENNKTHKFYVKDNAGNVSEVAQKAADKYVSLDEKPEISEIKVSTDKWTNKAVEITIVASAKRNGNKIAGYKMDDGEWQTSNVFKVSDNKEHTFRVKDLAGRESDGVSKKLTNYDATAPVLKSVGEKKPIDFQLKGDSDFVKTLHFLSFGLFFNKEWQVKISAEDLGNDGVISKIASAEVNFIPNEGSNKTFDKYSDKNGVLTFVIDFEEVGEFQGTLEVVLEDNAGNTHTEQITKDNSDLGTATTFMIENDAPDVSNITDEVLTNTIVKNEKIYSGDAKITFDVQDNKSGIRSVEVFVNDSAYENELKVQKNGDEVAGVDKVTKFNQYLSTARTSEGASADTSKYTFTITTEKISPDGEGKYSVSVKAVDNSGNVLNKEIVVLGKDKTSPVITKFDFGKDALDTVVLEDYGYYFKDSVSVKVTASDNKADFEMASGVANITIVLKDVKEGYYTVDTNGNLLKIDKWENAVALPVNANNTVKFVVNKDFKGQIFAYATDNVGNEPTNSTFEYEEDVMPEGNELAGYRYPTGAVLETPEKHASEDHITISINQQYKVVGNQNEVGSFEFEEQQTTDKDISFNKLKNVPLFNDKVKFDIVVSDTYSGIRAIEVSQIIPKKTSKDETKPIDSIEIGNNSTFSNSGLDVSGWTITGEKNLATAAKKTVEVDGDYNSMVLLVKMTDCAENESYDYYEFGIDKQVPRVTVTMNDNDNASKDHAGFFKENRKATVTIQERNFKQENVKIFVKVIDENGGDEIVEIKNDFKVSESLDAYTDVSGEYYTYTMNLDEYLTKDGDYTFEIVEVIDLATRKTTDENVSYINGAKTDIRKICTNFTIDKKDPTVEVEYDNNSFLNGNYYKADRTAKIKISEHNFDAKDVVITVNATNKGTPVTSFVVPGADAWVDNKDNTHTLTIAYNIDAKYEFDIEFLDMAGNSISDYAKEEFFVDKTAPEIKISGVENLKPYNDKVAPVIKVTDTNFDKEKVTIDLKGANTGYTYKEELKFTTEDIEDGLQRIYQNFGQKQVYDDIYTLTVSLTDKAGNTTPETIQFSVNRYGSVYDLSGLSDIIDKYLQEEKDIVFTETNVDPLDMAQLRVKLTKDGTPIDLVVGEDFTIEETSVNGGWKQYKYTISKTLFEKDGKYSISVYSVDKAGNINENEENSKNAVISFGIDKTKPVIVPVDFESGKQYDVPEKIVTIQIKDNLVLADVKILLNGDKVDYEVNGESYTFKIPEMNKKQTVEITAIDAANNPKVVNVVEFLVTTNGWAQWYYNTPLFVGSIIGFVVLGTGIAALIIFKKKKKASK